MTRETDSITKIFTVNLGVKPAERVLVFTDTVNEAEALSAQEMRKRLSLIEVAKETASIGKKHCIAGYAEFPSVMGHGKEPPEVLWAAAFGKKTVEGLKKDGLLDRILTKLAGPDDIFKAENIVRATAGAPAAIVALSCYSTSHTRFRDLLTRICGVRYASMPMFEREMLSTAMTADWKAVEARTKRLVDIMNGADTAVVTSHNGTSINMPMTGRPVKPDTGIITAPGSFSNLPAGEAFLAPLEDGAEGTLVLEWSPTEKLSRSITLTVKKGRVVEVDGDGEFARGLRDKIMDNPLIGNIAELGVGTNEKASRPDNILETEKILGTVHIALGDNSSFGGKVSVPFHQDFIFFKPTLEVFKAGEKIEVIVDGSPRF